MTKLDPVSSRLLKEEIDSMINENMYDQFFEDSLVQMIMFHDFQLFCKGHFAQSSRLYSLSYFGFSSEYRLEARSDQRLDKEKLREECEREIKADELYPVGKERQHIEACVVGIVEESRKEAHSRTHNSDSRTDDRSFKEYRVCLSRI